VTADIEPDTGTTSEVSAFLKAENKLNRARMKVIAEKIESQTMPEVGIEMFCNAGRLKPKIELVNVPIKNTKIVKEDSMLT
jgi:hypothetical protein